MRILPLICAAVLIAPLHGPSAQTVLDPAASDNVLAIGTTRLALPAGKWRLISDVPAQTLMERDAMNQTPLTVRTYLQTEGGKVAALLLVSGNSVPRPFGWGQPNICTRKNVYWTKSYNEWTTYYDCAIVGQTLLRDTDPNSIWRPAFDAAQTLGGMPERFVIAQLAESNGPNEVGITLLVNPEIAGLPPSASGSASSEWVSDHLDADHRAYLAKVVGWVNSYRSTIRNGLH